MPSEVLKPLAGLRVLDFTVLPPGAACTVMLADLGAEVIRVEPPAQKGKPSLVIGQVPLSRAKKSITLDLRDPAANAVLLRIAPTIDVVVENARPGAMEARGFGYAQARAANPRLIWCAITGFGQDGPYAEHAGHDLSYLAHSGLLGALSKEQPWHPATMLAVPAGGQTAVIAILAALLQRARSGAGAFVDVSLSEAAGWFLTCAINPLTARAYAIAATPDRRLYACADGRFVAVTSAEPRTWAALCAGLGLPDLADRLHQPDADGAVAGWIAEAFVTRSAAEWVDRLANAGAAVTIVNRAGELIDDPHVRARGSVVACGGVAMPASPLRIATADGAATATALAPPHTVGADTADVLASGGFSDAEIVQLTAAGVI